MGKSNWLCHICRTISAEALTSDIGLEHIKKLTSLSWDCRLCCDIMIYLNLRLKFDLQEDLRLKMGPSKTYWHGDWHNLIVICIAPTGEEEIYEPLDSLSTLKGDPATRHGIPELKEQIGNTRSDPAIEYINSC
jgi:hypothetical protein